MCLRSVPRQSKQWSLLPLVTDQGRRNSCPAKFLQDVQAKVWDDLSVWGDLSVWDDLSVWGDLSGFSVQGSGR